jgi:hypothetical protein
VRLSEQATMILQLIAAGRSYDQILQQHPELTYFDIFAAAREALDLDETAPIRPPAPEQTASLPIPLPLAPLPVEAPLPPPATLDLSEPKPRLASFVERARATHGRAFTRWSRDEDERLARLFHEGAARVDISRQLDRHPGAVERRLEKLGLIPPTEQQSRKRPRRDAPVFAATDLTPEPGPNETVTTMPGWEAFRARLTDDPAPR